MAIAGSPQSLRTDDAPSARRHGPPELVSLGPLVVFTRSWQLLPPRDSLTVIVKGTFTIVPGAPAEPHERSAPPSGDRYTDGDERNGLRYGSDFALLKARADVTLVGTAHAPSRSATAMRVRFRFGSAEQGFDRSLAVLGDRPWVRSAGKLAPGAPTPFTTMPLGWERAFGGPDVDANPAGRGAPPTGDAAQSAPPNLEREDALLGWLGDRPEPVGFGPIAMRWPARWSKLGSYGGSWRDGRWPFFPEDFDPSFFQAAPAGQQLDRLRGDEPFEVTGLSDEHPVLGGSLPALRVRCFAHQTREAGGGFFELALKLDTVHLDFDELSLAMVWRGVLEVSAEQAPELGRLFVMTEPLGSAPASLEAAYGYYLAALHVAEPADLVDEEAAEAANENADAARSQGDADARAATEAEQAFAAIKSELAARGVSVDEGPAAAAPGVLPKPDPKLLEELLARPELDPKDAAAFRELLAGVDQGRAAEEPAAPEPEPNRRQRALAMLAAGESFDGLDLAGVDLSELDLSGRSFVGTSLRGASLRASRFEASNLTGALLSDCDLRAAVLTGAMLEQADLTGANLEQACFDQTKLAHAELGRARAARASFLACDASGASFAEAQLELSSFRRARLDRTNFTSAKLAGACFDEAQASRVVLLWADATGASFQGTTLDHAVLLEAKLESSRFDDARAEGANFQAAELSGAVLRGSDLRRANLSHARCTGTCFDLADLREARLDYLDGQEVTGRRANLMHASAHAARLRGADLRGASLYGAALWKAELEQARLELANVKATLRAQ